MNFLNARACRKQFGHVFTAEDEPSFDDNNIDFMYPDLFMKMLAHDMRKVFNTMIDAVDVHQSRYNLFVPNMILMNDSFYTLKDNPGNIVKLKKYMR
ncbi:hypothetical protein [Paenibacillus thiaminolyticus]|uniref:Uncharacterized protein n=1 Tax=Paenibacillus thiaminolyticus TaxID=49283 RepID=A0A3A3GLQ0_PANTH|nr:hypothetical protein [Paenibacillus thiaminolyticus]RJG25602.1 hypothetical protein DQX05_05840 [Paenibacillus thiaminolyticus]